MNTNIVYKRFLDICAGICILMISGCFTEYVIPIEDQDLGKHNRFIVVCTTDSIYEFEQWHPGILVSDSLIVGKTISGKVVSIPVEEVRMVSVKKIDLAVSGLACLAPWGVVALIYWIALMTYGW